MSVSDKLRQRRMELQMTRAQLAARVRVTPSAIANYENGVSIPKPDILISLIIALEVDANYLYSDYLPNSKVGQIYGRTLSSEEVKAIQQYKALPEVGRRMVRVIIGEEYARMMEQQWVALPCYLPGTRKLHSGFLMQEKLQSVRIRKLDLPQGADFCFQIQIDRYEPIFRKYDIVALEKKEATHNEMGIFFLNGVYYVRILFCKNGERKLRALNVTDPDIHIREEDSFHCLGKILEKVDGVLEETEEDEVLEVDESRS